MRRFLALAAGLIAAWLVLASPAAADPELVEFHIDAPDRLTVGDRYRYVVTLEGPAGTEAGLAPGSLPPELALISQPTPQRSDLGDGRERIVLEIEVAVFQTGAVEVPALSIEFQQPDGARGTIATPPSVVAVASVLPATGELTPRDLKPQAEIGRASALGSILTALAVVIVALLLVLLGLWWLSRRKPVVQEAAVEEEELGPEDRARRALDQAGAAFAADRDYVAFYAAIAVTIRNYLTERYGFPAFALTTRELQHEMQRRGIDRWQSRLVYGLLSQCDAAVYAGYRPALERADHDLTAAYEIVEMSRPRPPEEKTVETEQEEATVG